MISFFRRLFSSKFGVVLAMMFVVLIGAAFALAGISAPGGSFFNSNGTTIASVDGNKVSDERIAQLMMQALNNAREQQPGIDMAILIENGALDDVLQQYMQGEALSAFARDNGLLISKRLIDASIAEIPAFQGPTGNFAEASFRQILAQQGLTEADVRDDLTRQRLAGILLGPVTDGVQIPNAVAEPYAGLRLEERAGQVTEIPSSAMPDGAAPTDEEIEAFYAENLEDYTLSERRSFRYAVFSLDQIDIPEPSDEQIREYYDASSATYGGSETRTFQQIILADEADALAFYAAVDGGADFGAQATERGFALPSLQISGATQESFARTTSAEIAAAAFATNESALLEPMQSGLGWHIVRVAGIVLRDETPLAAVRSEIVQILTAQNGNEALGQFYFDIENAIDDGASFEEIVDGKGMTISSTPLLAANGLAPDEPNYRPSVDLPVLLQYAFTLSEEEDPGLVPIVENQRYAMVDVREIARSAAQPLALIRDLVTEQFLRDRAAQQALTIATEVVAKVNDNMSLTAALAETGVSLPAPQPVRATRRAISQAGRNVAEPVRLLFRMAKNTAKLVRLPQNQGWFVVVLDSIESDGEAVTPELIQAISTKFASVTAREYAEQFVNAVMVDYPIERDEDAVEALSQRLLNGRSN